MQSYFTLSLPNFSPQFLVNQTPERPHYAFFIDHPLDNCNNNLTAVSKEFGFKDLSSLLAYFTECSEKSTVATNKANVTNEKVRKSRVLKNIAMHFERGHCEANVQQLQMNFNSSIDPILPLCLKEQDHCLPIFLLDKNSDSLMVHYNYCSDYEQKYVWNMLVYEGGDFFSKHTDGRANTQHYGTLLLFPPKCLSNYVGGDLIVHKGEDTITITADEKEWTLVGLPMDVEHECTPVISGKRIVFKAPFMVESKDNGIFGLPEVPDEMLKIDPNASITFGRYKKEIDSFLSSEKMDFVIVLDRYYNSVNPKYLEGEDRNLFMAIRNKYPDVDVVLFERSIVHSEYDDFTRDDGILSPFNDRNGRDYDVMYQTDRGNKKIPHLPGKLVGISNEYNDDYYENYHGYLITCIVVCKKFDD